MGLSSPDKVLARLEKKQEREARLLALAMNVRGLVPTCIMREECPVCGSIREIGQQCPTCIASAFSRT